MRRALLALLPAIAAIAAGASAPVGAIAPAPRRPRHFAETAPAADARLRARRGGALVRLRGGGEGPVEAARRAYVGVPLVTRSWLSLVLALAALSQAGIVKEEFLAVDAAAIAKGWQWWRPLTAAAFIGGVGPQLLQKGYYLVSFGADLERQLKLGEFLRVVVSCVAVLTLLAHMLGWPFVADGIIMAVTVLTCLQNPDQQISMYGLRIPYQYLPYAQLAMSYMFTQQIPFQDIVGLFVVRHRHVSHPGSAPRPSAPALCPRAPHLRTVPTSARAHAPTTVRHAGVRALPHQPEPQA